MSRLKMPGTGLHFVNFFSSSARETIHLAFFPLLFSTLWFPVALTQDLKRTSRTNCGYDIIQKGEGNINSLNKKVINSLNKLSYLKCGNAVVD